MLSHACTNASFLPLNVQRLQALNTSLARIAQRHSDATQPKIYDLRSETRSSEQGHTKHKSSLELKVNGS
jgi:hypothetical protein